MIKGNSIGERVLSGGLRKGGRIKASKPGMPLISIITVVYNRAAGLELTWASVTDQTYPNVEYIIVDGGSTDGTLEVIRKYDDRIDYWISEPDQGIYDAMNKGIDLARGEWINFMNCGDRLAAPDVLELFRDRIYDADLLYGDAMIEYQEFDALFKQHPLEIIWKKSPFCHQACFIRTALMKEYKFDRQYKIGADHDLFFRAYKAGKRFLNLNTLICYFDGKEGTTKKWIVRAVMDKMRIAMKYEPSLGKWLYYRCYLVYLYLLVLFKGILGPRITIWITRFVKGKLRSIIQPRN